ncbi:uncharacterized protein LOC123317545 [Coccinella septempunctata]|uniref:uncharacterized protein LOC123317545 n=1 Tax=Coccinella septempunctata TaxID=41139 RepID=UPI001D08FC6B|nr:uncharacterized protein LOC123317545 [Coccinella septempunctata]
MKFLTLVALLFGMIFFEEANTTKKVQCVQCKSTDVNSSCRLGDWRISESCYGRYCFAYLQPSELSLVLNKPTKPFWTRGCTTSKKTCKGSGRKGCMLCYEDKCNINELPTK